jgi:hypothetical protein
VAYRPAPVLQQRASDSVWLTGSLPAILTELAKLRNPAAHGEKMNRDEAARWRRQLVGVGCQGELVRLAGVEVTSTDNSFTSVNAETQKSIGKEASSILR